MVLPQDPSTGRTAGVAVEALVLRPLPVERRIGVVPHVCLGIELLVALSKRDVAAQPAGAPAGRGGPEWAKAERVGGLGC